MPRRLATPAVLAAVMLAGCGAGAPIAPAPDPDPLAGRREQYLACKTRAGAWLDALTVDAVDLVAHGVKGKKKLAEILDAYAFFHELAAGVPDEQARIMARVGALAEQTRRPEYHNIPEASETELLQNSMSYLRVLSLLEDLGLDTAGYRRQLARARPRLDDHMQKRGPWQRAMFRKYYERFELPLPPALQGPLNTGSVLERRPDPETMSRADGYRLTHQVFVACNYGRRRTPAGLGPAGEAYLAAALPILARHCLAAGDPDLLAEVISSLTYLGWRDQPVWRQGVIWLLEHQNDDGTWGDYEQFRPTFGPYLDQHAYLHTTGVCIQALGHAFESPWAGEAR